MAIEVTFATSLGGDAVSEVDHGDISAGSNSTAVTVFLSHNAENAINNCKLYIAPRSADDYSGDFAPDNDYSLLLNLGDGETSATFGGLQFNLNAEEDFPSDDWGTVDDKDPDAGYSVRTGVGDESANGISLTTEMGCPSNGVIPAGDDPDVSFKMRIKNPSGNDASLGTRQFDLRLRFSYTT